MNLYSLPDIKKALSWEKNLPELLASQKQAFIDFSKGHIQVPFPLQMSFQNAEKEFIGDCHIKAGFKENDSIFLIKIATGFYQNKDLGLPSGEGAVLIFSKLTGELQSILHDKGYLTQVRTALAAGVASQITPFSIEHIGIVGTGTLAQLVSKVMEKLYPKIPLRIWGRNNQKVQEICERQPILLKEDSLFRLIQKSQLIITTTASYSPILRTVEGQKHVIALGADEPAKQELHTDLFQKAGKVLVDSKAQAQQLGDSFHAIQAKCIDPSKLEELGDILKEGIISKLDSPLLITDLTGISAQDIAITQHTFNKLDSIHKKSCNE